MTSSGDFEARLDELYSAPLGEFIALRNQLAADLKSGGDGEGSEAVRRRSKPSLAAWTANRLFFAESETFDELVEAGERLRQAQQAGDAAALNQAGEQRRAAIGSLLDLAGQQLAQGGHALGATTLAKVERTLEAVAVYGRSGLLQARPGRLERELEPPGFEVLATLQSLPARPPRRSATKVAAEKVAPEKKSGTGASGKGRSEERPAVASGPRRVVPSRSPQPPRAELAEHRRVVKRREAAHEKARQRRATLRDGWRQERDEARQLDEAAQAASRRAEEARREADRAKVRVRRSEAALDRAEVREREARDRLEQARAELERLVSGAK